MVYNWNKPYEAGFRHFNLVMFAAAACLAITIFLVFHLQIDEINRESSILLNLLFVPSMAIGFLYGVRITSKAVVPSETRNPVKRSVIKIFLFFFVIGGLFSSVSFALNGGSSVPVSVIWDLGIVEWVTQYVAANGGGTFLIVSSIALMAAATRRLVDIGGNLNRLFTFLGTFIFFSMLVLSFTQNNPSESQVYLFTFYQAGIVGGALFEMNKLTRQHNDWEDFQNGY